MELLGVGADFEVSGTMGGKVCNEQWGVSAWSGPWMRPWTFLSSVTAFLLLVLTRTILDRRGAHGLCLILCLYSASHGKSRLVAIRAWSGVLSHCVFHRKS